MFKYSAAYTVPLLNTRYQELFEVVLQAVPVMQTVPVRVFIGTSTNLKRLPVHVILQCQQL